MSFIEKSSGTEMGETVSNLGESFVCSGVSISSFKLGVWPTATIVRGLSSRERMLVKWDTFLCMKISASCQSFSAESGFVPFEVFGAGLKFLSR